MFASFKWSRSCKFVYPRLIGNCRRLKSIRWAHGGTDGSGVEFVAKYAWKAVGFTLVVGCSSFALAPIVSYERHKSVNSVGNNRTEVEEVSMSPNRFQKDPLIKLVTLVWTNLSEMQKVTLGIIGVNVCVHLMWMNPLRHNFLVRLFVSSPSGHVFPMLFCCFSHVEFWHLFINMVVLWKVVPAVEHIMTAEQFVATYISSGVFGILVSNLMKISRGTIAFSLGASSSVFALLTIYGISKRHDKLGFDYLPHVSLPAGICLLLLLSCNMAGLLLRWGVIDYGAHIGGALFGCGYLVISTKLEEYCWKSQLLKLWKMLTHQNS